MRMGVVADDVTGSNDIGVMFAKMGYLTHVYSPIVDEVSYDLGTANHADIVILNTNSRLDPPDTAYKKVYEATLRLKRLGCQQFYNKTCSVFRGNIGAEFDAMLDALSLDFSVVVLGFPKNGRITLEGVHFVHGKKLECSEFRNDPIHPMKKSNIVEILQDQTKRKVDLLDHWVVGKGPNTLREAIDLKKENCQYLILDVVDQEALRIIARAVQDEPVLCGSSALAEELPPLWEMPSSEPPPLNLPYKEHLGILITSGSLMPQTAEQIEYLKVPHFELCPERLFTGKTRQNHILNLVEQLADVLGSGQDVVLYTTNLPDEVKRIRQIGFDFSLTLSEISRLISTSLAKVTAEVLKITGQNRLVVAGGETSDAVCKSLGIYGLRIWKEIQPGLPSCISLAEPKRLLVLKSGSFGKPDFLEKALKHLRST